VVKEQTMSLGLGLKVKIFCRGLAAKGLGFPTQGLGFELETQALLRNM